MGNGLTLALIIAFNEFIAYKKVFVLKGSN
jgi:hypothetical protein